MAHKILIPVDFSIDSFKAVEYALQLNQLEPLHIDLVHIFTDTAHIYQNALDNPELVDPRVSIAKRRMEELTTLIQMNDAMIQVNSIFADGNLHQELKAISITSNYTAILMATKGSSGLDSLVSGSNMFDVFQNSNLPCLAIPYSEDKFKIQKIGLLCNFKEGEIDVLKQATQLFGKDFELTLIHINTENETISSLDKKFLSFIDQLIEKTRVDNISYIIKPQRFSLQDTNDISDSINTVIKDEKLDALLVTKSKKSFFRKIIEEDIVKKMAYQIQIPKFFSRS